MSSIEKRFSNVIYLHNHSSISSYHILQCYSADKQLISGGIKERSAVSFLVRIKRNQFQNESVASIPVNCGRILGQ